jgi:hypothetical protein
MGSLWSETEHYKSFWEKFEDFNNNLNNLWLLIPFTILFCAFLYWVL